MKKPVTPVQGVRKYGIRSCVVFVQSLHGAIDSFGLIALYSLSKSANAVLHVPYSVLQHIQIQSRNCSDSLSQEGIPWTAFMHINEETRSH